MQILTNNIIYMEKNLDSASTAKKIENLEIFTLRDDTGNKVMELLSEKKDSARTLLYSITIDPILIDGSADTYDTEAFGAILQKYIEHLQEKNPDSPFCLVVDRKANIADSFYITIWNLLKNYADTIVSKSGTNKMILTCE